MRLPSQRRFEPTTRLGIRDDVRERRLPGDQGPSGVAGENGAFLATAGRLLATWDLDTDIITSFRLEGFASDLCDELS